MRTPTLFVLAALLLLGQAAACTILLERAGRRFGLGLGLGLRGARGLFVVSALTLPVVGPAAVLALMAFLADRAPIADRGWVRLPFPRIADQEADHEVDQEIEPLNDPRNDQRAQSSARSSPGSIEARLRFASSPERRVEAVLDTQAQAAPEATRLLRLALRDTEDDVRLLAHALLERRQRRADEALRDLEAALAAAAPAARPRLELLLAELSLDLAGSGLLTRELEAIALGRARTLLEHPGEPGDLQARWALLLGRTLLAERRPEPARAALEESLRLGMPALVVDPLLAEVRFSRGAPTAPGLNGRHR
jgi:tetratricopeptide (TPR) repeat protein